MKYFRYELKNLEPLRISDDSISQSGQTATLRYIPGTSIRGYVINQLSRMETFEQYKKVLFSNKVRFLNAYLMADGKELLPSLKGFYEEKKAEGDIVNVLATGDIDEGMKRAALGRYCYYEKDTLHYYKVDTASDMKIKIGKGKDQAVFRNEYIAPGYHFAGYIAVDDEEVEKMIADTFTRTIVIGNQKSQALGKCQVMNPVYVDPKSYSYKEYLPQTDLEGMCYLMLLSNTAMRGDDGEYEGLCMKTLEGKMGVEGLEIELCASSVTQVRGYNRNWNSKTPSVPMYEAGSVFKLKFKGILTKEKMEALVDSGIGIRKNEGFGRLLFLKDYESISKKKEEKAKRNLLETKKKDLFEEDKKVLKLAATNYYRSLLEKAMQEKIVAGTEKIGYMNGSQIGNVRSILFANRYDSKEAFRLLDKYFAHVRVKEEDQNIQKQKKSKKQFINYIQAVIDQDYPVTLGLANKQSIMGIPVNELLSEEDLNRMKIRFLLEVMSHNNRKGDI